MTIGDFKTYVKTGKPLDTEEIHCFMDDMSDEARQTTFRLNTAYNAVIATGAVVTKDVTANTVVGGVPAIQAGNASHGQIVSAGRPDTVQPCEPNQ